MNEESENVFKIPLKYYKLDSQPIHKKNSLNNVMMKN